MPDFYPAQNLKLALASRAYSSSIYAKDTAAGLRHFCELMVDYISAGHFEVYDHLIQEAEEFNDGKGLDVARRLYPQVSKTTEVALAFNDSFDEIFSHGVINPQLARELSVALSYFDKLKLSCVDSDGSHEDHVARRKSESNSGHNGHI